MKKYMKRLSALIFTVVLMLSSLSACDMLEGVFDSNFGGMHKNAGSHSISYASDQMESLLLDGFAPKSANPGDTVVLRTGPIMDADLVFYANGAKLTQTHSDSDYWEYTFTMPNEDVVITHDIVGGGPAPANYFLRERAGCEWLNEITTEDIAEIKIINEYVGVAPGRFKSISSSTDEDVISTIFEEYYRLNTEPIPTKNALIAGGSAVTVKFILKDGTAKVLYFNNGNYRDTNGDYFDLFYVPKFTEEMNTNQSSAFITESDIGIVYRKNAIGSSFIPSEVIGEIDIGDLEFQRNSEIDSTSGFDPEEYGVTVYTSFDNLTFVTPDTFIYNGFYYTLLGKSLEEMIDTTGVQALIDAHEGKYSDGRVAAAELYYGEYSSGAIVGMIVDDKTGYDDALGSEKVGGYTFNYYNGNRIVVLYEGQFYTLGEAFDKGYLTKSNIIKIWKIHNY